MTWIRRCVFKSCVVLAGLILVVLLASAVFNNCSEDNARNRAMAYAQAVNAEYETPEKIYAFLCDDFKSRMSEKEFCKAFKKERSYPYITPLYLGSNPKITLSEDGKTGMVEYDQAARIVGMIYKVGLVYENGDYYIVDWEDFPDGSYLEKFNDTPYSIDWYY